MRRDDEWLKISGIARGGRARGRPGVLGRLLSYVATAAFLVLILMFSVAIFAVLAVAGVVVGGWFWWKTRAMRREIKIAEEAWRGASKSPESPESPGNTADAASGVVIEGEVIRVDDAPNVPAGRANEDHNIR